MTQRAPEALCDPVLVSAGIPHGFGVRGSQVPESTWFPRQVHGVAVLEIDEPLAPAASARARPLGEADTITSARPGTSVGVVTADCVPILVARRDASRVAAIHAGWRGLAAGVVERGLAAVAGGPEASELVCAVGPAARGCCYEVDEPVRSALARRYPGPTQECVQPGHPGHFQLDLAQLVVRVLEECLTGEVGTGLVGARHRDCTICDPRRFESFRRDGAAAGRLRHFIVRPESPTQRG